MQTTNYMHSPIIGSCPPIPARYATPPMRKTAALILALGALVLGGCSTTEPRTASAPGGLNLRQMIVPAGKYGRHIEFPLRASYITIHSTDNRNATARQHGIGMAAGNFRARTKWNRTGYMTWHFT